MKLHEKQSGEWTPGLTDEEKDTLFSIVTDTLEWCVNKQDSEFSFDNYAISEKLKVDTATFVTLTEGGMLRGCIGSLEPHDPMYKSVYDNAVFASMHDHRFRPVTPDELPGLDVHISILSPIVDIPSLDDFNIGEHGIIIKKGANRAVFLPEVAVEQRWDKEETLSNLSMKAGLDSEAWRDGAEFQVFSSVVLSEDEIG